MKEGRSGGLYFPLLQTSTIPSEFQHTKLKWPAIIIMYVHSTPSKWPWLSFLSTIKDRWTKKLFQHYCRRTIWPRFPWVLRTSVDRAPAQCLGSHRFKSCWGLRFFSLSRTRDMPIISSSQDNNIQNTEWQCRIKNMKIPVLPVFLLKLFP